MFNALMRSTAVLMLKDIRRNLVVGGCKWNQPKWHKKCTSTRNSMLDQILNLKSHTNAKLAESDVNQHFNHTQLAESDVNQHFNHIATLSLLDLGISRRMKPPGKSLGTPDGK